MENLLLKCDNIIGLRFLRDQLNMAGKIDLVYIDPPFATGSTFSADISGRVATVSNSSDGYIAYQNTLKGKEFLNFL